jgi:hypothetical protein
VKSRWVLLFAIFCSVVSIGFAETTPDQPFLCGNLNPSLSLGKEAAIPAIRKKYTGSLKALIIRIGFPNAPFAVDTATLGKTNVTINKLYASMSRNTFQWNFSIHPQILAAPNNSTTYDSVGFDNLQAWITAQIKSLNLKRGTDYDVYIAVFPQIPVLWAGLSNLNDADWINGGYPAGVVAHELGHSLGLPHAHSIEAGTDIFGVPGTVSQSNEYGNPYDVMGNGGSTGHFNVAYKWNIGWLDTAEVIEAKTPGTYRIYAHDNDGHKGRLAALRVPSGNASYAYWFEYRSGVTATRQGALMAFTGFLNKKTEDWFLDTTPGSRRTSDETDGILSIGKDLQDKYGTTSFHIVAVNTGIWDKEGYVDVEVIMPGALSILVASRGNLFNRNAAYSNEMFNLLGRKTKMANVTLVSHLPK